MGRPRQEQHKSASDRSFLPDFCTIRMVFSVVVVAELLAFVLLLGSPQERGIRWEVLGIMSLFIQWVALSSAALLCLARPWLSRLGNYTGGVASYALVLAVTLAISELAFHLGYVLRFHFPVGWHLEFLLHNLAISAIVGAVVLRLFYLQHQQRAHLQAQVQARIEALQARIRPHFLFNSMNTIAALIRKQPQQAEQAVEDLADLFRFSLADVGRMVTLEQELESAWRYLHMEQLRLGDRLAVEWDLGDVPLDALLPPLMLQPLLENAIYHGIEQLPEGGTITVRGHLHNGLITLALHNPLPPADQFANHSGRRMAMENIRERLHFAFGRRGNLSLQKHAGRCWVKLTFPAEGGAV